MLGITVLTFIALTTFWGIPTGVWVVIGTIVSGVILRWADKWIRARTDDRDDRKDFREQITELNVRVDKLEEEISLWRERYNEERNHTARLERFIINKDGEPPPRR